MNPNDTILGIQQRTETYEPRIFIFWKIKKHMRNVQ